jgi:predicted XRE-type DNA-binding protein
MPKAKAEKIVRGSGNVFADLGFGDAEERQTKLRLAFEINRVVKDRNLPQARVAELLNVNQPKVSALVNYKLDGFSVERLMSFLTMLDRDVEIVVRKKSRSRSPGRITVVAA